jgi:hypothetical protein
MSGGTRSAPFYKYYESIGDVCDLIDAVKRLVTYVKQSKFNHELSSSLKQENATRSNSLLRCLASVAKVYDELRPLLATRRHARLLDAIDQGLLKGLIQFFELFQEATLSLEAFKTPTIHLVAFWVN